ncbi:Bifunctional purine biosynthesis protein PurH [Coemansia erecta]|nr:Bifunctional purine biosynthesis protein PurH [Coemansia erecta]
MTTPRGRNVLGGGVQFACNLGIMLDNAIALGLAPAPRWRILFALTGVFGLINFVLFPFASESPKWLISKGRFEEARESLAKFRKGADIEAEFAEMVQTDKENKQRTDDVNVFQVLRGDTPDNLRHQLLCVSALMFFQQLCGINAVIFYSTSIINKSTKSDPADIPTLAQILTFVISLVALIFTFFGMVLGAYFGRRTLLMFSHGTMGIFSAIMVAGSVKDITGLVVTMVFLFNAFFNLGVGPIPWATAGEMTPRYAMTAMSGIGTGIGYIFTFVIGVIFPPMQAAWQNYTFFFFMAWNIAAVTFVFLFVPETKDRRIEDTVKLHSCGIHTVLGNKWQVVPAKEKDVGIMATVDSRTLGLTWFQLYCMGLAAIGSFNFGWNIGSVNIPGDVLENCVTGRKYYGPFPSCIFVSSSVAWGVITGCYALGSLIGAIASNPVIDRKGYKFTLSWFALLNVAGALLMALTTKLPQFIIGRIVVGVAAGAANNALSTYVSDIATARSRTIMGGSVQVACNMGIMLDNACALGLAPPPRWRVLFSLTGVFGLVNFALFPFASESPKWLISKGRLEEARESLAKFRKGAEIDAEFDEMVDIDRMNKERTEDVNVLQLLRGETPDNLRHQLMCVSMLLFLQQFSGINAVIFYSTSIINKSTKSNPADIPTLAQILSFLISVAALVFTVIGMGLGAVFGRRTLLMFSHGTMAIFSAVIVPGTVRSTTGLVVTMVFCFNAFFNLGVGPIPWATAGEMTPRYAMTAMSGIGTGIGYVSTFIIGVWFPAINNWWKDYTFLFFMCCNILAVIFIFFFIPETRDRPIEGTVRLHSCGIHTVLGSKYRTVPIIHKAETAQKGRAEDGYEESLLEGGSSASEAEANGDGGLVMDNGSSIAEILS